MKSLLRQAFTTVALALCCITSVLGAPVAGKKISDYTETLSITDAWLYEIAVPGVTNYKVTFGTIATNIIARVPSGSGSLVTNADQFGASTTLTLKSGPMVTNGALYGVVSFPGLTPARPAYINASGVLTNATGTPDGLKYMRDDGVLATPAGGGDVTTSQLNISITNKVSTITGQATNITMWSGTTNQGNLYMFGHAVPATSNTYDRGSFLLPDRTNYLNDLIIKETIELTPTTESGVGTIWQGGYITFHSFALPGTTGRNLFVGKNSGNFSLAGSSGNLGSYNVAFGTDTLTVLTTGTWNAAFGDSALSSNTVGQANTAIGNAALTQNTTGQRNTSVGDGSSWKVTTGEDNAALGYHALSFMKVGSNNTAVGMHSLYGTTNGNYNTALGSYALYANVHSAGANVAVGYSAGRYATNSNEFYVDNQDRLSMAGDKASALFYGVFNSTSTLQRLTINALTGIGTTNPANSLHVVGNAPLRLDRTGVGYFENTITVVNSGSTADMVFNGGQASSGFLFQPVNAAAAVVNALAIDRNGNVGIGTTSPSNSLHVKGTSPLRLDRTGVGYFENTITAVNPGSTADLILNGGQANSGFLFQPVNSAGAVVNALAIDRNGNVGIGTNGPLNPLHVVGTAPLRLERNGVGYFENTISVVNSGSVADLILSGGQTNSGFLFQPVNNIGAVINALAIDRNGNVGIGTIAPSSSIDVTGQVRAASAIFTNSLVVNGVTITGSGSTQMVAAAIGTLTLTNALSVDTLNVNTLYVTNSGRIFVQTNTVIVTNTATTSALLSGQGTTNISANLLRVGNTVRIRLFGIYFTPGAPAGTTLTLRVLLNGTIAAQSSVVQPPGGMNGQSWELSWDAVVRATGASGILMPGGMLTFGRGVATTSDVQGMPRTATTTIDTTAAITVSVDASFNNTTDADAIHCQGGTIEIIP